MKLPITDEFLWDVYNLLEKTSEISDEFFLFPSRELRSLRECTELTRLRRKYERKKARTSFGQFVYYLKKQGYIKIKNLEGEKAVLLTKKGAEKVLKTKFKLEKRERRKDGKWLMVLFDIPEKKRKLRNFFREYLQVLGFKMLQKSVWVCPFGVLKEVESMAAGYLLDPYVKIFLIEEIEIS